MGIKLCDLFNDQDFGLYVGTVQYRVKVLEVYLAGRRQQSIAKPFPRCRYLSQQVTAYPFRNLNSRK